MSRFDKESTYMVVRRWIDHDIAHRYRAPSVSVSSVFTGGLFISFLFADSWLSRAFWLAALLVSSAWTGFVLWRASRIMRATTIRGDRDYDRRGKYLLPAEYAASESTTEAGRRRRRNGRP